MAENIINNLYHGTDARIISWSKEERQKYMEYANIAIQYMWDIYKPYMDEKVKEKIIYHGSEIWVEKNRLELFKKQFDKASKSQTYYNLFEKLNMIGAWKSGKGQYQYGGLYLATLKWKARNYAMRAFAGGEFGLLAYRLIEGIEFLKLPEWNPDKEVKTAIEYIKSFAENKPCPVIITVNNLPKSELLDDCDKQVDWDLVQFQNDNTIEPNDDWMFHYKKDIKLDLSNAEYL